ncbi:hypothetical protein EDM52_09560 [Brevibacillus invocatus]|uniref:Uncharacterized protein n=1 Tax=Brevibacillus invocatus TaxID=173959 RepID=A0A3M8CHE8_9BACL|nr:hypothetical protein [Brevibacillus invocatus]RNB74953.1 hypothetical protein EDM52_09560 [Brevibacillus invocatus]
MSLNFERPLKLSLWDSIRSGGKKENLPLASTYEMQPESAALDAGFPFFPELGRNVPQREFQELGAFSSFFLLHKSTVDNVFLLTNKEEYSGINCHKVYYTFF